MKSLRIMLITALVSCLFSCVSKDDIQKQINANNEEFIKSEIERIKQQMVDSDKVAEAEIQNNHQTIQQKITEIQSNIKSLQNSIQSKETAMNLKIVSLRKEQLAEHKKIEQSFNAKLELYRKAIAGQSQALNQALESFEEENKKELAKNAATVKALETFLRRTVTEWQNQSTKLQKEIVSLNKTDKQLDTISKANSTSIGNLENLNRQSYKQTIELYSSQLTDLQKALKNMQKAGSFLEKKE